MNMQPNALQGLNEVAAIAHSLATQNGFHPDNRTEDQLIESACNNLHNEVSELHEAWRNNQLHERCDKWHTMSGLDIEPLTCAEEEIADIILRALDLAAALDIDIGSAVDRKHRFNANRSFRHGNKRS